MTVKIDARGLSCPQPLILLQKAIKDGAKDIEITVDNETSRENIVRFADGKFGIRPEITVKGIETLVKIKL